jgi:mono/diheme cytochrome c family protein
MILGRRYAGLIVSTFALSALRATLAAEPSTIPSASVMYSRTQAQGGQEIFQAKCAGCHSLDLAGGRGPPLKGDGFWSQWDEKPARTLYARIRTSMPVSSPGSLTEKATLAIIAYILQVNEMPAGETAIDTANDLNDVKLQRPTKSESGSTN